MNWLRQNWLEIVIIAALVIPSLITGLSRYPKAAGVVHWLRVLLDLLSVVTHSDSPGSLKLIGARSGKPASPPSPAPIDPPGVGLPLCLVLLLALGSSACNPTQIAGWKGFGHDLRICANPSVEGAINAGAAQLVKAATGESVTKDDLILAGKGLVASYGIDLAICALEAAARNLGPLIFGGAPDSDPRARLGWMQANAEKWLGK